MNSFRKLWEWWQLEALRAEFHQWDITRLEKGSYRIVRLPVRRDVFGNPKDVRKEIEWLNEGFSFGVFDASRLSPYTRS